MPLSPPPGWVRPMSRRSAGRDRRGAESGTMDRKLPGRGSEDIELYIRTYYSLLRSSADVQIRTLEEVHANMGSSLHPRARGLDPDLPAFIYGSLRLPPCIVQVERVLLGQTSELFRQRGFGDVEAWPPGGGRRPGGGR